MTARRLASGGLIDRTKPVAFRFDGKSYQGFAGDTLASALLANGVQLVGRSFKYHRPRGIMAAWVEDPNAMVQLIGTADEPNVLATSLALTHGLQASSINGWPSVNFDIAAAVGFFSRLLPAGFYYKTFMKPAWAWPVYERVLRRMAGLGRGPVKAAATQYRRRFDHCDLLIVGAGPAGLAAASAVAPGARVLLVDDHPEPGGSLLGSSVEIDAKPGAEWAAEICADFDGAPETRRMANTTAWGYWDHNLVGLVTQSDDPPSREVRLVRAKQIILATGAIERPLVFADNDRPGVMLAGSVVQYAQKFGVAAGLHPVFYTNNDSAYEAAAALHRFGVAAVAIADTRAAPPAAMIALATGIGTEVVTSAEVTRVRGGKAGIRRITLTGDGVGARTIACDLLCMSGGWSPTVHLFSQSGGSLRFDEAIQAFVPGQANQQVRCVGAVNGAFSLTDCLEQGGAAATVTPEPTYSIEPAWRPATTKGKAFMDFASDVTISDIRLALREGYQSVEHLKRYTTTGMGGDQGKLGNTNAIGLVAAEMGVAPQDVGTTTFRPPFRPIAFGAIAGQDSGRLIRPVRETPMTHLHIEANAVMYESGGGWRRPGYYPHAGETMAEAIARETRAVRGGVGIYDSSPLGKFEIQGRDAVEFLERIYTNTWKKLAPGRGRYGLMLNEDGSIFDDGVTFCLGEHHYLMTTTTGGADAVYGHMERLLQCEWPDLQVFVTAVTTQWANAVVCGPDAREVLERVGTDIDLDRQTFGFMELRQGVVAGFTARIARVSFTGELSFEVNVPARHGAALWQALTAAGAAHGITPIGSEANHVLRIEKGYVTTGYEVDGLSTPQDLGMRWMIAKAKEDYIGARSLVIHHGSEVAGSGRAELVGLLTHDPATVLPEGGPVLNAETGRRKIDGFVAASVHSATLGRSIALALLRDGRAKADSEIIVQAGGDRIPARVVAPVFFDPDGERLRS